MEHELLLLHNDHNFAAMASLIGLRIYHGYSGVGLSIKFLKIHTEG